MAIWERIWSRLTIEEQRQATREVIVQSAKLPESAASLLQVIAEQNRTRPEVVGRWSIDKQADYLARARMKDLEYGMFLTAFFIKYRQPMLIRMLDLAEIPNVNGCIDIRTQSGAIATEGLVAGIRGIDAEFPSRDVGLYLEALEGQAQPMWRNLPEAIRVARQPAASPSMTVPPVAASPATPTRPATRSSRIDAEVPIVRGEVHLADIERFTALDAFLRDGLIATAAGTTGAPSGDRMRSVVEELIQLNETRHRSWFHLGFLDVSEGREPDLDVAHASERNRGWYFAGAVAACARSGDDAGIVAMFDRHQAEARRVLGDRHEATGEAAGSLVGALCAAGRSGEAVAALAATAVSKGGDRVYDPLLIEAERHLRESKAAEASAVLTLLMDGVEAGVRRQDQARPGLADEVALLRATAHRVSGAFDRAIALLDRVVGHGESGPSARAEGERGLVACRARSLSEVRLPLAEVDLPATAARLAPGIVHFERASVGENPRRAEADFVLGIHRFAMGDVDGARTPLERAVAAFRAGAVATEGAGTPARARFALGVLLAETLDVARAEEAVELLVSGATDLPGEIPVYALARALSALTAIRAEYGTRVILALTDALGDRLVDVAVEADLVAAHDGLRESLAIRTENPRRPRRARGEDAAALLLGSLPALDIERATRALAVLEDLADDAEGRGRLLRILEDRAQYDPAWTSSEALDARVRLCEAEGRYADAARLLMQAAHEALSRDPERGLETAREFVGMIAGYGIGSPDAGLLARIAALEGAERAPVLPTLRRRGRVFVIGGNEVQARYEAWLRADVVAREPGVVLDFDFAGWSSNWGRNLGSIERRIAEADAIVVMRFIRTLLGRTVRELSGRHGKPWIACTGHGRDSVAGAIERAIGLLPGV